MVGISNERRSDNSSATPNTTKAKIPRSPLFWLLSRCQSFAVFGRIAFLHSHHGRDLGPKSLQLALPLNLVVRLGSLLG